MITKRVEEKPLSSVIMPQAMCYANLRLETTENLGLDTKYNLSIVTLPLVSAFGHGLGTG